MSIKVETTLQQVSTVTLTTTIPQPIVKALNLKKGDKLEMYVDENDRIIIEKAK